ncbi:MAG: hypothetical protein CM15mV28_0310 [Thaumasvirus sp.]|nr:MAG: hypothetical protein CM15mV28_0310 [Thaumasvirus sp.]
MLRKIDGLDVKVGDLVASTGNVRLGINILNNLNVFTKVIDCIQLLQVSSKPIM